MGKDRGLCVTEIDFLLTYRCLKECDHCFVWGGPSSTGTFSLKDLYTLIGEGEELGTVKTIYFEGGEPFLYYPILLAGLKRARECGFEVGVVSDAYWATSREDAEEWLRPIASIGVSDLSLSCDRYHGEELEVEEVSNAVAAAKGLGIPVSVLAAEPAEGAERREEAEGVPVSYGEVMYRGRAATELSGEAPAEPWTGFYECPYEDLENQTRVHIDPFGYVHVCQGIAAGNALEDGLGQVVDAYDPRAHPIAGPLIDGGPRALVETFELPHGEYYMDACHLCYECRLALREEFPHILAPKQMYGSE